MQNKVLFVLKNYPRLSETFIAQEIWGLERKGLVISIVALRHPTDKVTHPIIAEISAPVSYLCEYLHDDPWRVWRGFLGSCTKPGFGKALQAWMADLFRDFSWHRFRRFGQALVLANEMAPDITHLHAHFIHTPTSVARYAALISGKTFSISAHAKDIWTSPTWELREKLQSAEWSTTCTAYGCEYLNRFAPATRPVKLIYHGLDLIRFKPLERPCLRRDGSASMAPVELLTVCRAVAKKGLDDLLTALAHLPPNLAWRWTHIGGGDLIPKLQMRAHSLGLSDKIVWIGAKAQSEVLAHYRRADIFVLPCKIAEDGDRDGLPNVLMEAQSQALACISTAISGVPELIEDGKTGLLVHVDTSPMLETHLAQALLHLITSPTLRRDLGLAGQQRVEKNFAFEAGINALYELFTKSASKNKNV